MTRGPFARHLLPPAAPGQSVGLFGGSFDPPHAGHVQASETAMVALGLDRMWWLVTPGNPLKDTGRLPPLAERMAAVRRLVRDPRVTVTGVEALIGTRYTLDTVETLARLYPSVRFVLVIGADNWATFHRWQGWRRIAALVAVAVIDRPGATYRALASPAARAFASARIPTDRARRLLRHPLPAWTFLTGRRVPISSTMLRERARATRQPGGGAGRPDTGRPGRAV